MKKLTIFGIFGVLMIMGLALAAYALTPPLILNQGLTGVLPVATMERRLIEPLSVPPTRNTSTTIASASWAEFPTTDAVNGALSSSAQQDLFQMMVVTNFDSASRICIDTTTRAAGDLDCGNDSAPSTTCAGTTDDADMVLAGTQREFRFRGDRCIWIRSSVDQADAQFSLVVR